MENDDTKNVYDRDMTGLDAKSNTVNVKHSQNPPGGVPDPFKKKTAEAGTMLYQIGEIAEILGITKEGVRFLEKKGLIHSTRSAHNGYRYYSRRELSAVQQIRGYAAAGFTLDEAAEMVLWQDEPQMLETMEMKERALEEEIQALENKRRLLQFQKETIMTALHFRREPKVQEMEALFYFPIEGAYAPKSGTWLRKAEKKWMTAGPTVRLAKLPLDQNGRELDSKGICAEVEEAKRLELPLEGSILMPQGLYLTACICTPVGSQEEFSSIYRWALEHDWSPRGDMLSIVWLSTNRNGERCTWKLVRMAVKPKETQKSQKETKTP